jgi:hypothetical protein
VRIVPPLLFSAGVQESPACHVVMDLLAAATWLFPRMGLSCRFWWVLDIDFLRPVDGR